MIGGMPRSGTTLVETIVGSHSRIAIPPGDFPYAEQTARGRDVGQIISILGKKQTWKLWHLDNLSFATSLDHGEAFRMILTRYAQKLGKDIPGAKAPYSEFFIEDYKNWLADYRLRFITVVRNPLDVIASLKHSHIHSNWHAYTDLIEVQCRNWNRSATLALARAHSEPRNYCTVRYEDVVSDPAGSASIMCDFIGVDFQEEPMLNRTAYAYHDTNTSFPTEFEAREDKTNYIYKPASRKARLSGGEIALIGRICGEAAKSLGYEDSDLSTTPPENMGKIGALTKISRLPGRIYRRITR
jgi:hypothetical protein